MRSAASEIDKYGEAGDEVDRRSSTIAAARSAMCSTASWGSSSEQATVRMEAKPSLADGHDSDGARSRSFTEVLPRAARARQAPTRRGASRLLRVHAPPQRAVSPGGSDGGLAAARVA